MKMKNSAFGLWAVVLIAVFIMFINLGGIPLFDPDEPVYAETPKEMLLFHDFISPRIYGEYWYDKPPMYYWLVTAAFKVFGQTEFAARFPSALLAVVGVMYIYRAGTRLLGERAGLAAALILTTSIEYFYLGKAAVTDITLTLCLTVALLAFLEQKYLLMYAFSGLAVLTKGPVGLLFPGAIIFLYLLLTMRLKEITHMQLPLGIIIFAVIALPWYVVMYQLHGAAFIDTFLGFHNITRFTSPEHPEGLLWYYFIPVLIVGFFPWTAIMLQAMWAALADSKRDFSVLLFLNIWAIFIFVFFTISKTKLVSYILPMYPPLALIAGWYTARLWDSRSQSRPILWPVLLTILAAAFIAGIIIGLKQMPFLQLGAYLWIAVLALMTVMVWFFTWRRRLVSAFWVQVAGMMLFTVILVTVLLPTAAPILSTKALAQEFTRQYDGRSPVYVLKFLRPGFAFYTNVYGREIAEREGLGQAIAASGHAYFVARQSDYDHLSFEQRKAVTILASEGDRLLLVKNAQ